MKSAVKIDTFVDRYVCPDLSGYGASGYADPNGRDFAIENINLSAIPEGMFEVLSSSAGLRLNETNTAPAASTDWQDIYLYHGCTYLWCSRIRLKAGPQASGIYLGFANKERE